MFNNIAKPYYVEYKNIAPDACDYTLAFNGKEFLIKDTGNAPAFPKYGDYEKNAPVRYLFSIDNEHYFLYTGTNYPVGTAFSWIGSDFFRTKKMGKDVSFAGITAFHIIKWYRANRYCGVCGNLMEHDGKERMVYCPKCGNTVYPRISPAIILAVYDGDRLLMTKSRRKNARLSSLIAGFAEVGETLEEAAAREAFEETGVHIKNIRYYRSQPWGLTDTLLAGFYAELDGDPTITIQEEELTDAQWVPRDELECTFEDFSLTNDMIWHFKQGNFEELIGK